MAQAVDALVSYFGAAPFPHYTALVELRRPLSPDHEYGFSMEHLDSSHYFLAADQGLTRDAPESRQRRALFNFAHHVAHAWIPKRAYGEGYFPFSWELAPLLDTIWLSEGFARHVAIEALADAMPAAEGAAYRQAMLGGLRDFLRELMAWSARARRGFRVDELPGLVRDATGVETSDIWQRWLR